MLFLNDKHLDEVQAKLPLMHLHNTNCTEVFNQKAVSRMAADSVNLCRNVDEMGQGSRRCLFVGCRCEGVGFFRKELRRW